MANGKLPNKPNINDAVGNMSTFSKTAKEKHDEDLKKAIRELADYEKKLSVDISNLKLKQEAEIARVRRSAAAKDGAKERQISKAKAAGDLEAVKRLENARVAIRKSAEEQIQAIEEKFRQNRRALELQDIRQKTEAEKSRLAELAQLQARYGKDRVEKEKGYNALIAQDLDEQLTNAVDSISKGFNASAAAGLQESAENFLATINSKLSGFASTIEFNTDVSKVAAELAALKEAQENALSGVDSEKKLQKIRERNRKSLNKLEEKAQEALAKKAATLDEEQIATHRIALLNLETELNNSRKESAEEYGKALKENLDSGAIKLGSMAGKAQQAMFGALDEYMGVYSEHMTEVTARLNGAGKGYDYDELEKIIRKNTITSPYIKYTDTLDNLASLVELGIADNVAQRAFLQTISDKVVTTFDTHTSSMLHIIRLQQKDTTAARMGMEAELNELFNYYFSDTSYLSNVYDSVQEALIGVSSQYDYKSGVEFEYIVQKWLGSLGSVGVNDSTLTTIAQALSYLGTGDVDALSGNSAMQNLIVMSANRVGLDYGKMLEGGITSSDVNALLGSMISYIKDISLSNNNVVKAQYAELFGLTMSDMQAFTNLQDDVIASLLKNGMTYDNTLQELDSQIGQISSRMHISEMMDNMIENVLANLGTNIASSTALSGLYKSASFLESITGGIELPFITAFGNGFDLNMSLEGLVKTGVAGIGTIGTIISALGSMTRNPMNLNSWVVNMDKGQGFTSYANVGQLTATTSSTGSISNTNNTGISQSLSDTQLQTGEEVNGTQEQEEEELVVLIRALKEFFVDRNFGSYSNPVVSESTLQVPVDNGLYSPMFE